MKKLSCFFIFLFLFSCTKAAPQLARVEADEPEPRVESENHAVKLAKRHLALKNRDWGNISKVQEEEGYYRIAFETPVQEKRLIGQRVLLVNKDSGLVSVVQRR